MAEVIEVNDIHELANHHLAANLLLQETPRASFFHTLDWLEVYWRHFGERQRLRALVIRAAGQTIGILPLVVKTRPSRLGLLRVLTYPLDHWGCWYGPLGSNQAATLTMAFRHLQKTSRDWDLIDLPWIDHEGADRKRTLRAMQGIGWRPAVTPGLVASQIDLTAGFDAYLATRSQKFRHDLRRTRRKVESLGRVEFIRHRPAPLRNGDGDPRWDLYDACEEVACRSWQAHSPNGNTLSHAECRAFLRDAHQAAAEQGVVDLTLLKIDGRAVAFAYNYYRSERIFGLRTGYDNSAPNQLAFGKTLMQWMIEDSCERGDRVIELGEGNSPYKHRLRTGSVQASRICYAPARSLRGSALVLREQLSQRWAKRAS